MVKNLRESVLKDVLDTIDDISNMFKRGTNPKSTNALNVSSISKASKDLIMTFPVLCDDSIDPKTAAMVCKAVERKAVAMLQILFSSCAFTGENGREIIAQWHSNIDTSNLTLDDYMDLCDKFMSEASMLPKKEQRFINEAVDQIKAEMSHGCYSYPTSSISENSINDYKVNTKFGKVLVTEAIRPQDIGYDYASDYDQAQMNKMDAEARKNHSQADYWDSKKAREEDEAIRRQAIEKKQGKRDKRKDEREALKTAAGLYTDAISAQKDRNDILQHTLIDTDVKKCNELVPSLMIVRFNSGVPGDKTAIVTNEFVAGVKARLIAVDSYDIIDRIVAKNKDRSGLVNFIRATTKEISFVKDYLLAIDRAKLDAKNNSIKNRSSRIWKTLEKRSTRSVWKRLMRKTNDAACITTLVISAEVANILKKEYGINIANVKTASTIMDAYNLLALVIVDESTEVARFLYDGDDSFEDLSFSSLERESGDGSYKKVINLLSKMNRG